MGRLIDRTLDVAIIGAGIAGVVHLHYARQAGLDALVLERQEGVGGLWRQLPAWQDIQISPPDWALGDVPLQGPMQPDIRRNIEAWVARYGLADGIRTSCPVQHARHTSACWELDTPHGTVRARHLVVASGGHNTPFVPPMARTASRVQEFHSGALHDPGVLAGRDVLVVGGGASALDLIEQCLAHAAKRIVWAHRGTRWFMPTTKPKAVAGSVRPYARMQALGLTPDEQNAAIRADMHARYERFGLLAIAPPRPFDVLHDQLMPGRARMIAAFGSIERHAATVQAIEGREVALSDGARFGTDVLLWGTGYALDLRYFEAPRLAALRSVNELGARCACIFRSLDAPDLYFPGVGLDGIGAAPLAYAMLARSIMSHIRGTARLDMQAVGHKINHFAIPRYLAQRDPGSYPEGRGWEWWRELALGTPDDRPYPLP